MYKVIPYNIIIFCSGGWDMSGVTVVNRTENTISCSSSHLTSFAVLLDVHGGQQVTM